MVSLYDQSLMDSTIKGLMTSDIELSCSTEGKFISVKLNTSKKEMRELAIKQAKEALKEFKSDINEVKWQAGKDSEKLKYIVSDDEMWIHDKEFDNQIKSKWA